jgi:hypothetical protein
VASESFDLFAGYSKNASDSDRFEFLVSYQAIDGLLADIEKLRRLIRPIEFFHLAFSYVAASMLWVAAYQKPMLMASARL